MKELFLGMITAFDGSKQVAPQNDACCHKSKQTIWIIIKCYQFPYLENVQKNGNKYPQER